MIRGKRVLVVSESAKFRGTLLSWMVYYWKKFGHEVLLTTELKPVKDVDLAILHVDLTRVPKIYSDHLNQYPLALNGTALSIEKSLYSKQIVKQRSCYKGQVIVKTIANFGGMLELGKKGPIENRIQFNIARMAVSHRRRLLSSLLWKYVSVLPPDRYPIFETISDVPRTVWTNPNLMVEKFLPEKTEEGHALRHWYFVGDREFSRRIVSANPIVKWSRMSEEERNLNRTEWESIEVKQECVVPDDVRSVRDEMGLQFGRIDWVCHLGKPVVLDVNKTPAGLGTIAHDSRGLKQTVFQELAKGIDCYFKDPCEN